MNIYKEIDSCRLCEKSDFFDVIDVGTTTLANNYLTSKEDANPDLFSPLKVVQCKNCGATQLKHTVNGTVMFGNYLYASSESGNLRNYFSEYTNHLINYFRPNNKEWVVDVGSNDGVLLEPFKKVGLKVVGVEPAKNLCQKANERGVWTINDFFSGATAKRILHIIQEHPKYITCNNCFAHTDPRVLLDGFSELAGRNTILCIENAYWLDTVKGKFFDQIYCEHLLYYTIKPVQRILNHFGFELFRIERTPNQGGSIRFYARKGEVKTFKELTEMAIKGGYLQMMEEEENFGIYNPDFYKRWTDDIKTIGQQVKERLDALKFSGKRIVGYGCPAKATTLCHHFNIGEYLEYFVEDSPTKVGLYHPQFGIPIVSREHFLKDAPDAAIILAWNFADLIIERNLEYLNKGGLFINPLPEIKETQK